MDFSGFIKDNGKIMKGMAGEKIMIQMGLDIEDNTKIILNKDGERLHILMVVDIQDNIFRARWMAMAIISTIREISIWEECVETIDKMRVRNF